MKNFFSRLTQGRSFYTLENKLDDLRKAENEIAKCDSSLEELNKQRLDAKMRDNDDEKKRLLAVVERNRPKALQELENAKENRDDYKLVVEKKASVCRDKCIGLLQEHNEAQQTSYVNAHKKSVEARLKLRELEKAEALAKRELNTSRHNLSNFTKNWDTKQIIEATLNPVLFLKMRVLGKLLGIDEKLGSIEVKKLELERIELARAKKKFSKAIPHDIAILAKLIAQGKRPVPEHIKPYIPFSNSEVPIELITRLLMTVDKPSIDDAGNVTIVDDDEEKSQRESAVI